MAQSPRIASLPRFCLFAMLAIVFTACSLQTPETTAVESEGSLATASTFLTLSLWHTVSPEQAETLQTLADRWSRDQAVPVQIELRALSGTESMHQALLAAIQTQQTPDLAFVRPADLPQYAEADALMPLDSYWDSLDATTQADYIGAFLTADQCTVDNQTALLAMPTHRYQTALYINTSQLKETLNSETPPSTWDELLADCDAHITQTQYACLSVLPTSDMATLYFLSHNNPIVDPATQETTLADNSALAALQRLSNFQNRTVMQLTLSHDGTLLDFAEGRTLFSIEQTDQMDEYTAAIDDEFEWEVLPLPTEGSTPRTLATGGNLTIFHTTTEREALALSFLNYLLEPDMNARWAEVMGAFPVRHSALERLTTKNPDPHFHQAATLLPTAHSLPCIRQWQAIETQLTQLVTDTLNDVAPPETLLTTAAQTANNLLR